MFVVIRLLEECVRAAAAAVSRRDGDVLVMDCVDGWFIIFVENLVVVFVGMLIDRVLFVCVYDVVEVWVMFEVLEIGVDGVCLRTNDSAEVRALVDVMCLFGGELSEKLELVFVWVIVVKCVGVGDWCVVDVVMNFEFGEGMLVGSFASGLFLIYAENIECGYVNMCLFRVNVGLMVLYVCVLNGKMFYLSELWCGSEIFVCVVDGRTRVVNVVRVKMERCSMFMIEVDYLSGFDVGMFVVLF